MGCGRGLGGVSGKRLREGLGEGGEGGGGMG